MKQKCLLYSAAVLLLQSASLLLLQPVTAQVAATQPAAQAGEPSKEQKIAEHRAKAQRYMAGKQLDAAITELQALEHLTPEDVEVHGNLGVIFFFKNDCAHAVPELRRTNELRDSLWRQMALLGFCEERLGDKENAIKDLEKAFPHTDDAKLNRDVGEALLRLYAVNNDMTRAAGVMTVLRDKNPTDVQLLYSAYQLYTDLANEAMLSLSLVSPNSAEMHRLMAHESLRYGDRVNGIAQLHEALKANPKMLGLHEELADALNSTLEGGNKDEAEKEYKLALAENPNDELSLCRLGEIAENHGDIQAAYDYFSKAVQLRPEDVLANLGMAKAYIAMKQPEKAAELLEGVVKRDPTNDVAHFRLSTVYRQLKRYDDAKRELAEYQKYKEMKDKLRKIYHNLRLHQESPDEGVTDAEKKQSATP